MNYEKFTDLGLKNDVLQSITKLGFEKPSKIQQQIIPHILNGYDVVGQAQTGTGKTLAFAASILSKIEKKGKNIKAIILTPTRELALQVYEEFESLNTFSAFNILPVYGGTNVQSQIRTLNKGVDVIIGTPGRVMDLIKRKTIDLSTLSFFVLDEADEMLNMGFEEEIKFIFEKTKPDRQVLLFSATMPKGIQKLAEKYMQTNYQKVVIVEKSNTAINVKQIYYLVNNKTRNEALCRLIDYKNPQLGIIFCQRKTDVDKLLSELTKRNYQAEALHGDIAQNTRTQTLKRFKQGDFTFLIATDVAARGIHVDNIDLVINYNLPQDIESYIHRIGRTGRAGNKGEAITLVTPAETKFLKAIEQKAKCVITRQDLPTLSDIQKTKYQNIITDVNGLIEQNQHIDCLSYVQSMHKDELINFSAALLKLQFKDQVGSNLGEDINIKANAKVRMFLTVGKNDNLKMGSLLDFLKATTGIRKEHFTNIEIMPKFTFLDIDEKEVDQFIKKIYNQKFRRRIVRAEIAKKN